MIRKIILRAENNHYLIEIIHYVSHKGERIFFENDSKSALERFIIELLRNEIVNISD
jgi:hypothetical protein